MHAQPLDEEWCQSTNSLKIEYEIPLTIQIREACKINSEKKLDGNVKIQADSKIKAVFTVKAIMLEWLDPSYASKTTH